MIRGFAAAVAIPLLTGSVLLASPAEALLAQREAGSLERGGTLLAQDSEGGVAPFPITPRPDGGSSADSSAAGRPGESEGVSPFPIAPRPGGGSPADSSAAGSRGESAGVSPFPLAPRPGGGSPADSSAAGSRGESAGVSPFPLAPRPGGGSPVDPSAARSRGDAEGVSPFPLPPRARGSGDHPAAGDSAEKRRMEPSSQPRVAIDGGAAPGARSEQEVGVPSFPYDPEARADSRRACARACADHRDGCARAGQPVERCEGDFVLCFRDCATGSGPDDVRPPGN